MSRDRPLRSRIIVHARPNGTIHLSAAADNTAGKPPAGFQKWDYFDSAPKVSRKMLSKVLPLPSFVADKTAFSAAAL